MRRCSIMHVRRALAHTGSLGLFARALRQARAEAATRTMGAQAHSHMGVSVRLFSGAGDRGGDGGKGAGDSGQKESKSAQGFKGVNPWGRRCVCIARIRSAFVCPYIGPAS